MPESDMIDAASFLVNQLYGAITSSTHRILIEGLINPAARLIGVELNPNDGVGGSEWLNLTALKQMKFCTVDRGRICWIYPKNWLMPLPNVDRTFLLNEDNIYFLPGDKELARPTPPPHPRASSPPTCPCLLTPLTCTLAFSQFKRYKLFYEVI